MAQRRMFSNNIIQSAKFLKMPQDTQLLYFHLGLRADDDGIVEAFTVMRMVGSTEDSLKVLEAKGFIKILNEDLVTFITDWREHNKIRSDRKTDSIYKELLVQFVPNVDLLEEKERKDRPKVQDGTSQCRPVGNQGTDNGQPWDGIGKYSIGKDSIVEDSISTEKKETTNKYEDDSLEVELAKLLYNKMLVNNIKAKKPNIQSWAMYIDRLLRIDNYTEEEVRDVIEWSQQDYFWSGNILSTKKLREKFPQLLVKATKQNKPSKSLTERNMEIYANVMEG